MFIFGIAFVNTEFLAGELINWEHDQEPGRELLYSWPSVSRRLKFFRLDLFDRFSSRGETKEREGGRGD